MSAVSSDVDDTMTGYEVRRAEAEPSLREVASCPQWAQTNELTVGWYHPKSTEHRPRTTAKVLLFDERMYVTFEVHDQYVLSVNTEYQSGVCKDSCVEFFVKPKADRGYINFEINAGGTMLLHYNPPTEAGKKREMVEVPLELAADVEIATTMPSVITEEIVEPVTWQLSFSFPLALLAEYVGPLDVSAGATWRANFYKIASGSSHPHWGAWRSVGEPLNFHQPDRFGELTFG